MSITARDIYLYISGMGALEMPETALAAEKWRLWRGQG